MKSETKYLALLAILYFIVSLVGILHHELWLDESHHWLLSRDSATFAELITNTRYEGHPILWNILLFGITRFTLNPLWMQLLHICISTTAVIVFLRNAPFSLVFKALFIFGYFMIFEYNLISRNYILGVLFLFLACSVFKERQKRFLLLCSFLALAANAHLMFAVIAFALFLVVLYENFEKKELSQKAYVAGYLIFGIGILVAVLQIIPPEDTRFFIQVNEVPLSEKFIKGFISLFKGVMAVPDFRGNHFWNSNFLVNINKPLSGIFGLLLYGLPLAVFKNRKTLFFVYAALFGTQIFFLATQRCATRFDGMTYLILIVALWIDRYYKPGADKLMDYLQSSRITALRNPIIYGILLIHFVSGICAYAMDFRSPFTASKETAAYLKDHGLDSATIVTVSCDATAITPYLEKKVWFLCDRSFQSFCHWDLSCALNISQAEIADMLSEYMANHNYAVYVSEYPLVNNPAPDVWMRLNGNLKVRFRKKFDQTIMRRSGYYIYEISKLH